MLSSPLNEVSTTERHRLESDASGQSWAKEKSKLLIALLSRKPRLWKREQAAVKRLMDYNSAQLLFMIYDILERDKAWFNVVDTPGCPIYTTKKGIHSGGFVSIKVSMKVTFKYDVFPT